MVKAARVVVLVFTLVVALDEFGFQVAPLVAGIGVAGLGIVGEILHNYGTIGQLGLKVGVAYSTELTRALAAIRETLAANPRVLETPAALVGVESLEDSAVTIGMGPWVAVGDCLPAQAELYQAVVERFRADGIEVPFPQREVRLLGAA